MSTMGSIQKPKDRAIICTICGDAGTGKTRLAATFPKPIFIRAEDGMQSIPPNERPDAFPILKSGDKGGVAQLFDQLIGLLTEDHDYKTVVVDSVSALERLFVDDVMHRDGKAKSINQAFGGYGAGVSAVTRMHQRLRRAAGFLNERKAMNIVFIAHADIETMRLPDIEDYQRYSLRLPPKSLPPYVDDVDMVGFIRLATIIRGEDGERKKAISNGDRELVVTASAANVAKNRFGLTEPMDVPEGENPLYGLVPGLVAESGKATGKPARKPKPEPVEETTGDEKDNAQ